MMSADLEDLLRTSFASTGDDLAVAPDLATIVRRRVRRRRRVVFAATSAAATAAIIAGAAVWAEQRSGSGFTPVAPPQRGLQSVTVGDFRTMALSGDILYVASGDYPDATLVAYNTDTGQQIGRTHLPSLAAATAIGPGGSVWQSFYPSSAGGRSGLWRLSADLTTRSVLQGGRAFRGSAPFDVLPRSGTGAVVATDHGVATVRVPAPGKPGRGQVHWLNVHGPDQLLPTRVWSLPDGSVAIGFQGDDGTAGVVRLDGTAQFDPGAGATYAASPEGLWVLRADGRLILLDPRLRRSDAPTPHLDTHSTGVWTTGRTVWLSSDPNRLTCFIYKAGRSSPPAGDIDVAATPTDVAAAGSYVYVGTVNGVMRHVIPDACR